MFMESFSPENRNGVVFEDDGDAAYFYAAEKDEDGVGLRILDALHIHESEEDAPKPGAARVQLIWSRDWMKCALVIDGQCHALFDFEAQGGYNVNQWPPPNAIWTKSDRNLTDELIRRLF
jgi:hypothetical protein